MTDILIIGGGPAGLAAGLYAQRGGANTLLLEEMFAGGQIVKTHQVDNYPGFSNSPDGFTLGAALEEHARKFGLTVEYTSALSMDLTGETKTITTPEGELEAKAVILCMGANPRPLGIAREEEMVGRGLSYCATCDGAFYSGKTVAVIGGGDTAVSDAIYLARGCEKVYLIHRRDSLRAAESLAQAALAAPNIVPVWDSVVTEFLGGDAIIGLRVKNVKTEEESELALDGVFVAVGVLPRTELVRGQVALTPAGEILTNERMETNLSGVYAAGDIRNTPLRQVITACADGAIAAFQAIAYLS
ncbi:MAG: FAD-dependent oxidoreductase [Clostridiales bacterium]|nr:FAD-dependent oxidoreductase [Clostridiales bacterium]